MRVWIVSTIIEEISLTRPHHDSNKKVRFTLWCIYNRGNVTWFYGEISRWWKVLHESSSIRAQLGRGSNVVQCYQVSPKLSKICQWININTTSGTTWESNWQFKWSWYIYSYDWTIESSSKSGIIHFYIERIDRMFWFGRLRMMREPWSFFFSSISHDGPVGYFIGILETI